MKKLLLSIGLAPIALFAQDITYDEFSMNPGYENMVFYSMDSGVVGEEIMASWDLAFDVRSMGSSVRINGGQGTVLYNAGDLDEWENIDDTFIDMTAKLSQLRNDNSSWSSGAFSQGGDGMFDLGWGVYDIVTHIITSDKTFVIALPDGTWKKIAIFFTTGTAWPTSPSHRAQSVGASLVRAVLPRSAVHATHSCAPPLPPTV